MSAQQRDALETQVTRLSQQVNSLFLQVTKMERREKELNDELNATREILQVAEAQAAMKTEMVANLQRHCEMVSSTALEIDIVSEQLAHKRQALILEYEGRERQLRDEIGSLKAELYSASETIGDVTTIIKQIQRDMAPAAGEPTKNIRRAVASREDAMAEILHARISELTQEAIRAEKDPTLRSDNSTQPPSTIGETLRHIAEYIAT